nr:putative reverse transcriptase domain-containing protein [Tanacetum cinerariifolium]
MIQETTEKIILIKQRIQAAQDRQKSYADQKRELMEFEVGDMVMLKVSLWKGVVRFIKRGKLNPRYIGPCKVLAKVGNVAYSHAVEGVHIDDTLQFVREPVEIMEREIKRLKRSRITLVKVRWNSRRGPEFTWEREDSFKQKHPHLFTNWILSPTTRSLFDSFNVHSLLQSDTHDAVYKELGDSLVRIATTNSSLEAEHDSGNFNRTQSKAAHNESSSQRTDSGSGPMCQEAIGYTITQTRSENVSKLSNDSLLARGNTLQSDEDRMKLNELMELCTHLQSRVLELEKTKTSKGNEFASLKRRVKKLERRNKLRTHKLKILYKVGLTARVESLDEESLGEDVSKQERRIDDINQDEDITLVNVQVDAKMFDADKDLGGEEVFVEQEVVADKEKIDEVVRRGCYLRAKLISNNYNNNTYTKIQDKGKGIPVGEPVKPKKKDQIRLDEEATLRLQAEFDEEERIARERERAQKEQEATITLIETWDDVQAKIDAD